MTLESLYQQIGGNYPDVKTRLVKEERIEKFVLLFLKDSSCSAFVKAMEAGNVEAAFRAVHTLKGVCMNLGFDALYQIADRITEQLREADLPHAAQETPGSIPVSGSGTKTTGSAGASSTAGRSAETIFSSFRPFPRKRSCSRPLPMNLRTISTSSTKKITICCMPTLPTICPAQKRLPPAGNATSFCTAKRRPANSVRCIPLLSREIP